MQNDIFQWLDKCFCDPVYRNDVKSAHNSLKETKKDINETSLDQVPQQNGHLLPQQTTLQQQTPLNDLSSLSKSNFKLIGI